jgi:hypothetical protein
MDGCDHAVVDDQADAQREHDRSRKAGELPRDVQRPAATVVAERTVRPMPRTIGRSPFASVIPTSGSSAICVTSFSCVARIRSRVGEKQASRDADARALATGHRSVQQLRRENEAFAPLAAHGVVRLHASRSLG